jgi:hypothetical protein
MRLRRFLIAALTSGAICLAAQSPPAVDTTKIGPQVGTVVPAVSGTDQFGRSHTLSSLYGPKGAMLVFFRSADW